MPVLECPSAILFFVSEFLFDGTWPDFLSLTVYKNFTIKKHEHLQLRWEVFNALNHANFQLPVNNIAAPNTGTLTSTTQPGRQVQFGARRGAFVFLTPMSPIFIGRPIG